MNLTLKRLSMSDDKDYTIGKLYLDSGVLFCNTLEDKDRGLLQSMSLDEINNLKVDGATAIPKGTYEITLDVVSPKFSTYSQYQDIGGKLPRLLNVPGYEGVLIHIGNTAEDTEGCILVGKNSVVGKVTNSTYWFNQLYQYLQLATDTIYITIE